MVIQNTAARKGKAIFSRYLFFNDTFTNVAFYFVLYLHLKQYIIRNDFC